MATRIERFMRKVERVPWSGCWVWTGAAGRYGCFKMDKNMDAHRASWVLFKGEIPKGMCVCHSCDVTYCVNPEHLFVSTHKGNTHDMLAKGRHKFATWNAPRGNNHWKRKKYNEQF